MAEDLEAVRRSFLPASGIKVLFLGESPPPVRGFFYTGDSTLFRATMPIFAAECGFPRDTGAFLRRFSDEGLYVDDLSPIRGDKPAQRPEAPDVRSAVARLASLISEHSPLAVIGLLKSIDSLVLETVGASTKPDTPCRCLRFPYYKSEEAKAQFSKGLTTVIREFGIVTTP